eukprot:CAMPEP_0178387876 /NCGR_PEP_ID=MMETSP0689_2-20121128/9302_1 /TAXON_ID=160604 /ORGANISM="Amphidinium massartii, Strain CS-259" /LENGTH=190 /DNA_ID=CAMNT_0020008259 /DNA_START=235 /DNA_END=805 /DNA_ORIENTATION=-
MAASSLDRQRHPDFAIPAYQANHLVELRKARPQNQQTRLVPPFALLQDPAVYKDADLRSGVEAHSAAAARTNHGATCRQSLHAARRRTSINVRRLASAHRFMSSPSCLHSARSIHVLHAVLAARAHQRSGSVELHGFGLLIPLWTLVLLRCDVPQAELAAAAIAAEGKKVSLLAQLETATCSHKGEPLVI